MYRRELWQHITSGDVQAVMLDENNQVVSTSAPLHYIDYQTPGILDMIDDWFPENAEWFNEHTDEYRLYEPRA